MAKTALDLEAHWLNFIDEKVKSGRYASADEVVRDALKGLEDQDRKLADVLRQIDEGRQQAEAGVFVDDKFLDGLIEADVEFDHR
ncbi:type II toxin-antitoxin system ParD family antitoxin [Rhizobium wuzhouense]|uniref:Type II toxin-antitoxin system ParD family antitoxin n=1 Tax=Rhizobium wuzhouense TaxID=1986026 RepID=A0ABX5NMK9_9HYPH|nr:type II toxin-antitoxin system ParD family antitoxin [Rhizobium wuzhouense]PYB71338.1 type II toxin-antitoxin system ParD family antitoxin [Rhizobium wuzhouense]